MRLFSITVSAAALLAAPALAQSEDGPLTFSGSARARYESLGGQYRPGRSASDQFLSTKLSLGAELDLGALALVGELTDARGWKADDGSSLSTSEVNTFEVPVLHLRYDAEGWLGDGSETEVRIGRFYLNQGSRRLVAISAYPNVTTAFTGASIDWKRGDDAFSAFYTLPQNRLPSDLPALLDNDHDWDEEGGDLRFWGLFYAREKAIGDATVEAYLYGLNEEDSADLPTRNRDLWTAGGRIVRAPAKGAWDAELEGAWQGGTSRNSTAAADVTDLNVRAWFIHVEAGYTFDAPWSPRLALIYDIASGDEDPTDDEVNRFDPLYGSRTGDFGPSALYGPLDRSNISAPGVRVQVKPSDRLDGFVSARGLWLQEARDSFARTGVRDSTGGSGRFAGYQLETKARYWIVPRSLRLEVSGAVLFDEGFLLEAPNATGLGDTVYGAVDITKTF